MFTLTIRVDVARKKSAMDPIDALGKK